MTSNRGVKARAIEYFYGNVGRRVSLTELAKEIGYEERVVQQAVTTVIREKELDLAVIVRGRIWMLPEGNPNAKKPENKRVFQELATTQRGDILVECEDGSIYKLVEI